MYSRKVRQAHFLERPFLAFRTEVLHIEGGDLEVDIYVDRARLGSCALPPAGEVVFGTSGFRGTRSEKDETRGTSR